MCNFGCKCYKLGSSLANLFHSDPHGVFYQESIKKHFTTLEQKQRHIEDWIIQNIAGAALSSCLGLTYLVKKKCTEMTLKYISVYNKCFPSHLNQITKTI